MGEKIKREHYTINLHLTDITNEPFSFNVMFFVYLEEVFDDRCTYLLVAREPLITRETIATELKCDIDCNEISIIAEEILTPFLKKHRNEIDINSVNIKYNGDEYFEMANL